MSIGWALLGTGRHALKNVLPQMKKAAGTRLAAVVSRDRARGEAFAREHGFARSYITLDEALRDLDVHALYHATPDGCHAGDAIAGARAGRHSLIDKPLAHSLQHGQAVIDACRTANVRLGVVFNQRHEAVHLEARRRVLAGEIGEVQFARVQLAMPVRATPMGAAGPVGGGNWRGDQAHRPGGAVLSIGDHAFDTLAWITGRRIEAVQALTNATSSDPPNERMGHLMLKLSGGATGFASASFGLPWSQSAFEIHGTDGSMVLHNTFSYLIGPVGDGRPALEVRGESGVSITHYPESECFRLEIERFNRAIEAGEAPMTSGEEALNSMRVTAKAYASVRSNRVEFVE